MLSKEEFRNKSVEEQQEAIIVALIDAKECKYRDAKKVNHLNELLATTNITKLIFWYGNIGGDEAAKALSANKTICELDYDENYLTNESREVIKGMLATNKELRAVELKIRAVELKNSHIKNILIISNRCGEERGNMESLPKDIFRVIAGIMLKDDDMKTWMDRAISAGETRSR